MVDAAQLALADSLEGLPALVQSLGLEPTWEALDPSALIGGEVAARAAVVGRRTRFVAVGIAPVEGEKAQRLARSLARAGQPALVLGLDASASTLTLAGAFADCPTVSIRRSDPSAADLGRLKRGAATTAVGASLACHWAETLSGHDLGERFFRQFKRTLDQFASALASPIPPRDRHSLALLALTRVLFLYFVQERGWLDGRPTFLRDEVDRALGTGSIERALLIPLFFGTLNRPVTTRRKLARRFGRVPYLNGGLFELHPLERRWGPRFGDDLWRDAFDQLFERYHFAVRRAAGTSINPDMLGQVFEGVMDPSARRASGAFYTPSALVDRLFDAALTDWLALALGIDGPAARQQLDDPTPAALEAIARIAVLDPAAGSGAFLLGALRRLAGMRIRGGVQPGQATRAVLASSLYGVDLNPMAVRLAELRLWLEVLEAESSDDPMSVAPLPNLDSFVRQGDSLSEPGLPAPSAESARRLSVARQRSAAANGASKAGMVSRLRQLELEAACGSIERALAGVEGKLQEQLTSLRAVDLFANPTRPSPSFRAAYQSLRTERRRLRAVRRRLTDADELPWFNYAAQFGDLLSRGGFDLVVGNPPWVRGEALSAHRRAELRERYRWCRADTPGRQGFGHSADLSLAFLERSFELLKPDGVIGMLVPAKVTTAGYAAAARSELARRATLLVAERIGDHDAGFGATVYPLALIAAKRQPAPDHRLRQGLTDYAHPGALQRRLSDRPWTLTGADDVVEALGARHPTIGQRFVARLGVKTGCDRAFLDPDPAVGAELIRPVARGRDVGAFRVSLRRTILWPHERGGRPRPALPVHATTHLARHRAALERRADYQDGPYWQVFRTGAADHPDRVIWSDLSRRLEAAVLSGNQEDRVVPLNTTYLFCVPDRDCALRLATWLNTTWIRALAGARATEAASGYFRFNAAVVEALPFPDEVLADCGLLDIGRRAHRGEPFDQEAADARSAELLALTATERDALGRRR